jgi:hypothetical protein
MQKMEIGTETTLFPSLLPPSLWLSVVVTLSWHIKAFETTFKGLCLTYKLTSPKPISHTFHADCFSFSRGKLLFCHILDWLIFSFLKAPCACIYTKPYSKALVFSMRSYAFCWLKPTTFWNVKHSKKTNLSFTCGFFCRISRHGQSEREDGRRKVYFTSARVVVVEWNWWTNKCVDFWCVYFETLAHSLTFCEQMRENERYDVCVCVSRVFTANFSSVPCTQALSHNNTSHPSKPTTTNLLLLPPFNLIDLQYIVLCVFLYLTLSIDVWYSTLCPTLLSSLCECVIRITGSCVFFTALEKWNISSPFFCDLFFSTFSIFSTLLCFRERERERENKQEQARERRGVFPTDFKVKTHSFSLFQRESLDFFFNTECSSIYTLRLAFQKSSKNEQTR